VARLSLRVEFKDWGAIGPGKIKLLELIARHGSISAAGRAMGMSYRRAWLLVDSLNRRFKKPVVTTERGGGHGGGAVLTPFGHEVVKHYRHIEAKSAVAVERHLQALQKALSSQARPSDEHD
jgi:molybdate transport system regulatory protein